MSAVRRVRADLTFEVREPAEINLQILAARSGSRSGRVTTAGKLRGPATTIETEYGGTIHDLLADVGTLEISYVDDVEGATSGAAPVAQFGSPALELHRMLRPSRYCPSDHVNGLANAEFGDLDTPREKVSAIAEWIFQRVNYVPGASDVHDSAENTLLTGQGVCRDFAHLGIVLCRALDVPARFASVYAPGLDPMDFHAVFEAWHDDGWWVYDATRLAPRQSLVRIATGSDAADTSFATVVRGVADLTSLNVTATVDGDLPLDSHDDLVALA